MGKEIKSKGINKQQDIKRTRKFRFMGNLIFFPEGSDFSKERFFFFHTLLSDYSKSKIEPYHSKYLRQAKRIGEQAKSALSNSPFDVKEKENDTRFMFILKEAIKILKQGVIYEQNNELKYIQKKINDFHKKFSQKELKNNPDIATAEKILLSLKNQNGIDYYHLINLINILNQGLENTKSIYESEKEHMELVQKEFKLAQEKYLNQIGGLFKHTKREGLTEKETKKYSNRFAHKTRKIYLLEKTFNLKDPKSRIEQIVNANMGNTKSVDVKIANILTVMLQKVFSNKRYSKSLEIAIKTSQLTKGLTDSNYVASERSLKEAIIRGALSYAKNNMAKLLKGNINIEDLVSDLSNYISTNDPQEFEFSIEGMYENFAQFGRHLDFFKDYKGDKNARELYAATEELYLAAARAKKISDLTPEQIEARKILQLNKRDSDITKMIKLIRKLEGYAKKVEKDGEDSVEPVKIITKSSENNEPITISFRTENKKLIIQGDFLKTSLNKNFLNFQQFNPQQLSSLINSLKSRTSISIKKFINRKLELIKNKQIQDEVYKNLEQGLQNLRVSVGGPTWNEILPLIQAELKDGRIWSGPKSIKTDSIIIQVGLTDVSDSTIEIPTTVLQNVAQNALEEKNKLLKSYTDEYVKAISRDITEFDKNKQYNHFKDYLDTFTSQQEIRTKFIQQAQENIKQIQEDLRSTTDEKKQKELQDNLSAQQSFLEDIENTLLIGTTSKTYNNYMNNVGFVGGSLGQTIVDQISHLNEIFEAGGLGLTQEEMDWLAFAAVNNSSLSVVHHQNENKIEAILGSLATFALFTDGAAEVDIIKSQLKNMKKDTSDIMHLYFVNGMYYPGSYVLSQALQNVEQIVNMIEEEVDKPKNVQISSTVTFDILPNNDKQDAYNYDTDAWRTVAKKANARTSIQILFLSGLMSVVDGLLKELGEIELPK